PRPAGVPARGAAAAGRLEVGRRRVGPNAPEEARGVRVAIAVLVLALAATAAAQPLMTRSQAKAIVRDVNLKASDMPGYDSVPPHSRPAGSRPTDASLARCYGGVAPSRALATGDSPVFVKGTRTEFDIFGSIVTVFS